YLYGSYLRLGRTGFIDRIHRYHCHMSLAPIYLSADIRLIEAKAIASPESPRLMERAGLAAANLVVEMLAAGGKRILVLAGPGNNGGDAFEMAAHLKAWFYRVDLVFLGELAKLPVDAANAYRKWREAGGVERTSMPEASSIPRDYDLIVDGLFGIGLARPLQGRYARAIDCVNRSGSTVLALDIASGIDSDTGAVLGCAMRATRTLTFIARKPGLLTLDGADFCGEISVDSLGLDVVALHHAAGRYIDTAILDGLLPRRPRNFHKGNAGDVAILGGAPGMVGAALLAGRAAMVCGAGRVHLGLIDDLAPRVDPLRPELMLRRAQDLTKDSTVLVAGPGMGRDDIAHALLSDAIDTEACLVLDADALNLIATDKELERRVARRTRGNRDHTGKITSTVMTPHPAEAARLLGLTTREVQADRLVSALRIAKQYNANVALKGNGTIVASPDGRWWINSSGHSGMASAGMGDTLTGIIASLIAQGADPTMGLCAAVWLHGAAGEALAARHSGPLGTLADDIGAEARLILNRHLYNVR
ncbi:MAG: NAD(P)H-hydrate dehydratase, partial [Burkholderiales bacterium]